MKAYRIKHVPSGLYYQPIRGNSNLSRHGKVYLTSTNPLSSSGSDYLFIQVGQFTRVFNKVKGLFPIDKYGDICCRTPKEEFIIEKLNLEE